MSENIITEFIRETPKWVNSAKASVVLFSRSLPDGQCAICGVIPEKQLELMEAIKELQEKAWKYDELTK